MKLTDQIREIFSKLSQVKLSAVECSLLFYLFSRTNNFFEWLIVDRNDLAKKLSLKIGVLDSTLVSLQAKKIIKLKYSHYETGQPSPRSFSVMLNNDFCEEVKNIAKDFSTKEGQKKSLEQEKSNLISMVDIMKNLKYSLDIDSYANIIVGFFTDAKKMSKELQEKSFLEARSLLEKHSFDSVLFVLKHFYKEIDSLKLLDEKWHDYQSRLQENLNQIDFEKAKKEHDKENKDLRKAAEKWIKESEAKNLTVEEARILEIISEHEHPRRQLFWAYRFKENYPNLLNFFLENITRMLPVTTRGGVFKKKD